MFAHFRDLGLVLQTLANMASLLNPSAVEIAAFVDCDSVLDWAGYPAEEATRTAFKNLLGDLPNLRILAAISPVDFEAA